MTKDPKIRLFKEIFAHQPEPSRFKGCKAFLPVMHQEGNAEIPIVAEVEYQNPNYKPVPGKRFESHDEADLEAWKMNEAAGISLDVSGAIWESIKNADV